MQSYDFVELWAGRAVTSTVIRKAGRTAAALDITYFEPDKENPHRSNHYDILTPSGFLFPGLDIFHHFGFVASNLVSGWPTNFPWINVLCSLRIRNFVQL